MQNVTMPVQSAQVEAVREMRTKADNVGAKC